MADFLDDNFGAQTSPVNIDDLVQGQPLPTITLPEAAVRNRAATTALLSDDPSKSVENYQMMMAEAQQGQDTSVKAAQSMIVKNSQEGDMKGIMTVLSDPTLSIEQKQAAIQNVKNSNILKDTSNTLFTKALSGPSKGENVEQEDARLSSAAAIGEIYQARQDIQALVNAHGASLQTDSSLRTFGEMTEAWVMPFGNNINAGKIASAMDKAQGDNSVWKTIKRYALAGSSTADMRQQLEKVAPEQRAEFARTLLNAIKDNSGIVFSNDNQFAQFDKATSIFDEGGYGSTQEFLDNVSPLLDILGFGQAIRGAGKTAKVASIAEKAVVAAAEGTPAARAGERFGTTAADLASLTGRPTAGAYDGRIAALEARKAEMLGVAGNTLESGAIARLEAEKKALPKVPSINEVAKEIQSRDGITSKAAKSEAAKQIADAQAEYDAKLGRINSEIERNRSAQIATSGASDIEAEINLLKKNNTPVYLQKTPLADAMERIEKNSIIRQDNPAAPYNVIASANPQQARNLYQTIVKSAEDEVSMGLTGVGREQAIINSSMPQMATSSKKVTTKIPDVDQNLRQELHIPEPLIGTLNNSGAIWYTNKEKAAARANLVRDFSAAEGLTINDAMSSFHLDGGRVNIGAVYGSSDGSFLRAEDAFNQAKLALRNYGVRDDEITILKREGLDHTPVSLKDVRGVDGDYLVRVDTFHDFDPTDITRLETFDVKRNLFDRVGPLVTKDSGSASRYLFDAASMLHPTYTGAASVASDATARFEKVMLEMAAQFSDQYNKLAKDRKLEVDKYIREANYNGIKFDQADLVARGFQPKEIAALQSWRDFWDGHFYLENYDIVRSLNSQGYQLFKNQNTELYARPIAKDQTIGKLYDPATDSVVTLTKAEGDALYNSGGSYAKLRRPTDFNGTQVEHMIVRNTPSEYLRKFRDSDQVLNYRDGYFQIQYKAPKFVEEIIRKPNGDVDFKRAIAVAGDTPEAEAFAKRMASTTGRPDDFVVRGDTRALSRDADSWWDVNSASGRIAQRHRGKLLEDGSGLNHLGDGSYIMNPVDSAVRAAKSISGRTVSRPMLEAAKARFINQYGEMLPTNGMGGRKFPNSVKEISMAGMETSSRIADARTTYEYIKYLENGYINGVDEVFKHGMNALANMLGSAGFGKAERAALAVSESAPSSIAKNAVFMSYIGSNFMRQWIVQPHQVLRTFSYNPKGWLTGSIHKYLGEFMGARAGVLQNSGFTKFIDESGLLDAVDKSNLVRGTLLEAADTTNKALRVMKTPLTISRKVGFDIGEQANLLGHAAAVYDSYKRRGLNLLDKTVRDEAYSEIRAISYDMNFAGDMVYNQTSPAMLLQFMQVPHKAFLQMTNRRIPWDVRARMISADMVMWGTPTALVADIMGADILPDNPKLRELFTWGAESMLLNNMFQELFDQPGEKTSIDFSSLAPFDMTGWSKFFQAMYSGGLSQAITNSPAGQLFLKDGGRMQNAIKSMGRYFGVIEDIDEEPETFLDVMNELMKISSGWNNAVKAKILLDGKKKYDQYGSAIDKEVSHTEAWAQALGFGTSDTRDLYRISMEWSKDVKSHKDDTIKVYNDIKRYYSEKLAVESNDPVFITKVTGRVMKVFADDPVAMKIIRGQLEADLQGKDAALLNLFMKRSEIPNEGNIRDEVLQSPASDDQKKLMLQRIEDIKNMRKHMKE